MVKFSQLEDKLQVTDDYLKKLEVVKENYPSFFISFCKHHGYTEEKVSFI